MRFVLAGIVCLFSLSCFAQNKFTINGYVRDTTSGESIIGATISINNLSKAVATNQYGFYSITLDSGSYELTVSHVSYLSQSYNLVIDKNQLVNLLLLPKTSAISEVVVYSKR